MFTPKPKELSMEELTSDEQAKLQAMEHEIKKGEEKLQKADPALEPELEAEQEQRVSLYQQFLKLFQREHKLEVAYEQMQTLPDQTVTDDFRTLAGIQIKWLDRLPTRVKEEFKESPDYQTYVEILTRRGVARKK